LRVPNSKDISQANPIIITRFYPMARSGFDVTYATSNPTKARFSANRIMKVDT